MLLGTAILMWHWLSVVGAFWMRMYNPKIETANSGITNNTLGNAIYEK